MASYSTRTSTLADLAQVEGKAELIAGKIVPLTLIGLRPNLVAGRIYRSLADHADVTGMGLVVIDNMGFAVPKLPSGRRSFSPDVAFFDRLYWVLDMRFLQGPPTFAVEVRSAGNHSPAPLRTWPDGRRRADPPRLAVGRVLPENRLS